MNAVESDESDESDDVLGLLDASALDGMSNLGAIAMTVGEYDAVVTRFFSAELCDDSAADESTSLCGAFASDLMAID